MAVLSDSSRIAVWRDFMRGNTAQFGAVSKADVRAAVDALDTFLNDNAAAINAAIPQPARAELTTAQKALLLQFVIERRYGDGA